MCYLFDSFSTWLEDAASFLPMMGTLANTNTTIGLHGNVVFNSIGYSSESVWPYRHLPILSDFDIPAKIFHVECGLVDDGLVRQNGTGTDRVWNITSDIMGQNPGDSLLFVATNAPIKWLGESLLAVNYILAQKI